MHGSSVRDSLDSSANSLSFVCLHVVGGFLFVISNSSSPLADITDQFSPRRTTGLTCQALNVELQIETVDRGRANEASSGASQQMTSCFRIT